MADDEVVQDELDQERATDEGMPENPAAVAGVQRITAGERTEDASTPGMTRETAVDTEGMWAGVARTPAGSASAWHHHGRYESSIYVLAGTLRMEFGPEGSDVVEAGPGDFVYIAPGVVHREINPGDVESQLVVARSGSGEPVTNVEGPA